MNKLDMTKWLKNLKSDIGEMQTSHLWHYAEALDEIIKYLESDSAIIRCSTCRYNHNCEIQYAAQANDKFGCLYGEIE